MRALLVGAEPSTRHDFAFGWRSLQRSRQIDELPGGLAHPSAAQPLHLIGEDGYAAEHALPGSSELEVPLSDTSALAPALRQLVELSQQGSVIVGASPCGAHDGGAGAWHALTPRERQALAELAPRLTVAYVEETSLLGVGDEVWSWPRPPRISPVIPLTQPPSLKLPKQPTELLPSSSRN